MDYMMHSKVYAEAYAKAEISNFSLSGGGVSVESTSVTTETKVKTSSYAEGKITKTITSE